MCGILMCICMFVCVRVPVNICAYMWSSEVVLSLSFLLSHSFIHEGKLSQSNPELTDWASLLTIFVCDPVSASQGWNFRKAINPLSIYVDSHACMPSTVTTEPSLQIPSS